MKRTRIIGILVLALVAAAPAMAAVAAPAGAGPAADSPSGTAVDSPSSMAADSSSGPAAGKAGDGGVTAPAAGGVLLEVDEKNTETPGQQYEQDVAAVEEVAAGNADLDRSQQTSEQQLSESETADTRQPATVTVSGEVPASGQLPAVKEAEGSTAGSAAGNTVPEPAAGTGSGPGTKSPFAGQKIVEVVISGVSTCLLYTS
ncbi:MAG: hypothetical protein N3A57_08425, partial [Negativicutes bacterium]|nr:hypothetical protein [Negativicutes bacterium]